MNGDSEDAGSRPEQPPDHAHFELAKYVALITMTIDHYGKIVDPSLYVETNAIGRLAFPLFAWIIGSRLAIDGSLSRRYLMQLIPWALVTQPIYVWAGKDWTEPNIFFVLAAGVGLHLALLDWRNTVLLAVILISVTAFAIAGANYGVFGLLMIPLIAQLSLLKTSLGAWSAGPLGILGNLVVSPPYLGPGAPWAMCASLVAIASLRAGFIRFRLPRFLFYAYYPGHLLVLACWARLIR